MFPDPLAPKDLVPAIDENDADIGAVAFAIKHGPPHRIQYNYSRLYVSAATFNHARIYLPPQYPQRSPSEAEVASHQLMTRAGMIRKLAGGIYTYMPLGLKVIRKIEAIVRDEMNAAGAWSC